MRVVREITDLYASLCVRENEMWNPQILSEYNSECNSDLCEITYMRSNLYEITKMLLSYNGITECFSLTTIVL